MRQLRFQHYAQEPVTMVISRSEYHRLLSLGYSVRIVRKIRVGRQHRHRVMRGHHSSLQEEMKEMYVVVVGIAKRLETMIDSAPDSGGGGGKRPIRLFREFVDEKKLGNSFWKIYTQFYGIEPTAHLEGNDTDEVTFAAYLFILVEHEHLGDVNFSEKGKQPFFEYLKIYIKGIQASSRTFHNRITKTLGTFRERLSKETRDSEFLNDYWKRNIYLRNFLEIRGKFHEDSYYMELEPLLKQ